MRNQTLTPTQKSRESIAFFRNQAIEVSGDLYISTEDIRLDDDQSFHRITYELRDSLVWLNNKWQPLTTQSLSVSNPDPDLARSEFYARLSRYLTKRFGQHILTIKSTYHE